MSEPYGANQNMESWARDRGLRYSRGAACLHWVSRGRCGIRLCREGHGSHQWMDHVSGWIDKNGQRLLLSQPYWLTDIDDLAYVCKRFSLKVDVHGAGWYGHGTLAIELRPREVMPHEALQDG